MIKDPTKACICPCGWIGDDTDLVATNNHICEDELCCPECRWPEGEITELAVGDFDLVDFIAGMIDMQDGKRKPGTTSYDVGCAFYNEVTERKENDKQSNNRY